MKILMSTTYIYERRWHEFTRNKTGFGIIVNDIFQSICEKEEAYLISHVITKGHGKNVLKHTVFDVLASASMRDWLQGIYWFFRYNQNLKGRIQNLYYCVDKGYFRKQIKSIKPDIVHIHGIGLATKVYIEVCEELSIPYLVTLHGLIGIDSSIKTSIWEKEYEKEFIQHANKKGVPVSVISTGIKTRIEKYYLENKKADNISVVLNGTHVPISYNANQYDFTERPFDLLDFETKYKNALENMTLVPMSNILDYIDFQKLNRKKILVYVGNVSENKNQIQAVRCMKHISENVILILFGRECDNGEVRKYVLDNNLWKQVIIAGFCDNPVEIWKRADVNLFLSKNDGFGLPVIEGYMYGVPAVMFTDLDAFEDIAFCEGIVPIQKRDDEEVVSKIEEAVNKEWDRMIIRNKALQFSVSHMEESYINLYRNLCE